jgi:uncharacterized protein YrrD
VRLVLGRQVRCADDAVRELADVVIDASSKSVTHIVVQPHHEPEEARLVPFALAESLEDDREISLRCTAEELDGLERVHEFAYLRPGQQPKEDSKWDVGVEEVYPTPNYGPSALGDYTGPLDAGVGMFYDRVPKGEIELRHASSVYSADEHHLGSVKGLVVDADSRVTHLLLERGHLWWRREIPVPADAVSAFETDLVTLGVTKRELSALPS